MVTGGGPGAMEAAAQGSCEGGGYAIAFSIRLKKEEAPNPYSRLAYPFRNINLRKMRLTGASRLTLTFPGGIGTLDEGWENACAVQNGLTEPFPMYVVGANFYLEPTRLQYRNMLRSGTISPADTELMTFVDVHRLRVTGNDRRVPIFDGEDPSHSDTVCLPVIGLMDWLDATIGYVNHLDGGEYEPTSAERDAAEAALATAADIQFPTYW
jgi:hypothetical protein